MQEEPIRIGTRGSALALRQAKTVREGLEARFPGTAFETVVIRTTGDRVTDRALFVIGGKGLFTKELEDRLLDGSLDLAVHSLKDLPTELPAGLAVGAVLARASAHDALVTLGPGSLSGLRTGARVGTSSLRRRAQILAQRPDLVMADLRGNLDTRLAKLEAREMDAMVAARAGLDRLGFDAARFSVEDLTALLPAAGQGAVAVETAAGRDDLAPFLAALHDGDTDRCVRAERAFLAALGGGCHVPVGARGRIEGGVLHLEGLVCGLAGAPCIRRSGATRGEAEALGRAVARDVLEGGAGAILEALPKP